VSLLKFAPTIFTEHIIKASIYLSPLSRSPQTKAEIEQLYEDFAKIYLTKLASDKDIVEGPTRMGTGGGEAFCMRSVSQDGKRFHDSCIAFRGTWRADFQGEKEDRETFYRIIMSSTPLGK
jgi:hypothetical protein